MAPMKKRTTAEKLQYIALAIALIAGLALLAWVTVKLMPFFIRLSNPVYQERFRVWINSLGFRGWLIVLAIQMIQVIIALIPGGPVEIVSGVLYGTLGGTATCLLGSVLASCAIFFTVRRFGAPLVIRLFGEKRVHEFKFLNNTKKVEMATFILFLIPGTPKDMLTYVAGITPIRPAQFLLTSSFARLPSIVASAAMGTTMSRGNWGLALTVFLLTAAIGVVGILSKRKLMDKLHRHSHEKPQA